MKKETIYKNLADLIIADFENPQEALEYFRVHEANIKIKNLKRFLKKYIQETIEGNLSYDYSFSFQEKDDFDLGVRSCKVNQFSECESCQ